MAAVLAAWARHHARHALLGRRATRLIARRGRHMLHATLLEWRRVAHSHAAGRLMLLGLACMRARGVLQYVMDAWRGQVVVVRRGHDAAGVCQRARRRRLRACMRAWRLACTAREARAVAVEAHVVERARGACWSALHAWAKLAALGRAQRRGMAMLRRRRDLRALQQQWRTWLHATTESK